MLPENLTAVVARNESWTAESATEPYEAGWAREAIVFVRALKAPKGPLPTARIEISADGMTVALSMLAVDLIYPWLDPRVRKAA